MSRRSLAALFALTLFGCAGSSVQDELPDGNLLFDANVDAGMSTLDANATDAVDAATDAASDASVQSTPDAAPDAETRAPIDAAIDGSTHVAMDAALDASTLRDAGRDATVATGPEAGAGPEAGPDAPPDAPPSIVAPVVVSITPNSGPASGGTEVTITGAGLSSVTYVSIGGATVPSFTVVSDTTITATTPVYGVGYGSVIVSGTTGTSNTDVLFLFTAD